MQEQYNRRKPGWKMGRDLTGQTINLWTVLALSERCRRSTWMCRCACGTVAVVRQQYLLTGRTYSCGCRTRNAKDLTGRVFGRLTAIEQMDRIRCGGVGGAEAVWRCRCECGEYATVRARTLVAGDAKSCGCYHSDMAAARGAAMKGAAHPSWNPNLTDEDRASRRSRPYDKQAIAWRMSVFRRDRFCCVKCGIHSRMLEAHHKDGWAWCKERRYDVSNGVTLCEGCHDEYHSRFGKGKNTEAEFVTFMTMDISAPKRPSAQRSRQVPLFGAAC